ncbi:MAG: shikimate dehydrogenase [Acidimicrobiales bacterium]|nr:shikimate dehydrogenase [Hyphomonadaceae bacterium]RZV44098.1 MAG: shikimate dehydrogenase [Acidimicrobiales bacterium]
MTEPAPAKPISLPDDERTPRAPSKPYAKIAGVCGWPIHHSLSPLIQNFWLQKMGIKGAYTMFAVHPEEAVYAFKSLKRTTICGLNVTIPLKGKAFEAADEVTPDAQKLGVCNILYRRGDKLIGHNTDMEGFAGPLLQRVGHNYVLNNTVTVIGAGGAARAVIGALLAIGAPEIRLINRTDERAELLAQNVNVPSLYAVPWRRMKDAIYGSGLVVNASAAGMKGMPPLKLDLEYLAPEGWVYDLVYTPQNTLLLKKARKLGFNTIGGLDMLIAQARPSFKLFYEQLPPHDLDPRELIIQHLKAKK